MKYLQSEGFSTSAPPGDEYRDRWEATFGPKFDSIIVDTETGPVLYTTEKSQTLTEMVREFHTVFGQPILDKPAVPHDDRVKLRLNLISEEFFELLAACEVWPTAPGRRDGDYDPGDTACTIVGEAIANDLGHVDIVEVADALADMAYVIAGAALEFGIDLDAVLAEVHRSNMSKIGPDGKVLYNDSGKVQKPATYSPPDIAKVLMR